MRYETEQAGGFVYRVTSCENPFIDKLVKTEFCFCLNGRVFNFCKEGCSYSIEFFDNKILLHTIAVDAEYRGNGIASGIMNQLTAVSDETGIPIFLVPKPFGIRPPMSAKLLKQWYGKHGFRPMRKGRLIYEPKLKDNEGITISSRRPVGKRHLVS